MSDEIVESEEMIVYANKAGQVMARESIFELFLKKKLPEAGK